MEAIDLKNLPHDFKSRVQAAEFIIETFMAERVAVLEPGATDESDVDLTPVFPDQWQALEYSLHTAPEPTPETKDQLQDWWVALIGTAPVHATVHLEKSSHSRPSQAA